MKVYRMNEGDYVLHNSFEEAKAYHNEVTGVFEECKDDCTGEEFETFEFIVKAVSDSGNAIVKMTVQDALEKGLTQVPDLYSYEY